jgi:adenosylcobinamide-GDP ribazoletransferase
VRPLLSAISFLTILPVPRSIHDDRNALGRAVGWYPFVGLLVGLMAAVAFRMMPEVPPLPRAVLVVLMPVLLTRALHLDGFADVCDGLGVYGPPAKRLEVMRDPRLGTFGVAGAAFNLLWRVAVLASPIRFAATALVAAPVLGRWAMVVALRKTPYGKTGTLGAAATRPSRLAVAGATLVLILPFLKAPGPVLFSTCATVLLVWVWPRFCTRRFGGMTGDCLGALNELTELGVLSVFLLSGR